MHRGKFAASGHYYCYVRDPQSGIWTKYDDTEVTPNIPHSEVMAEAQGLQFGAWSCM